jgi:hypothetical protein
VSTGVMTPSSTRLMSPGGEKRVRIVDSTTAGRWSLDAGGCLGDLYLSSLRNETRADRSMKVKVKGVVVFDDGGT